MIDIDPQWKAFKRLERERDDLIAEVRRLRAAHQETSDQLTQAWEQCGEQQNLIVEQELERNAVHRVLTRIDKALLLVEDIGCEYAEVAEAIRAALTGENS